MRRIPDASPRGRAITVDLEGEALSAVEGEPVACSLLAAGEDVLARSIKYHRPRGAYCFAAACSQCLMRVDGLPNIYTCRTPARAGMKLERQNAFPSAKVDLFGTIDWFFPEASTTTRCSLASPSPSRSWPRSRGSSPGSGSCPPRRPLRASPPAAVRPASPSSAVEPRGLGAAKVLAERGTPFLLLEREERVGHG